MIDKKLEQLKEEYKKCLFQKSLMKLLTRPSASSEKKDSDVASRLFGKLMRKQKATPFTSIIGFNKRDGKTT
ncbi:MULTISPECIES: hypothetical protein [unclassified Bacillus (in: firmicutes)]|uniref:hypothetical protein n=1 Tax=unclassified Bacillus (in: firmicutes) TaxID=185979 RepID=UPI002FFFE626